MAGHDMWLYPDDSVPAYALSQNWRSESFVPATEWRLNLAEAAASVAPRPRRYCSRAGTRTPPATGILLQYHQRTRGVPGGVGENSIQTSCAVAESLNSGSARLLVSHEQIFLARIDGKESGIGFRGERRVGDHRGKSRRE